MARYVTSIRTPWSPAESFAYMADLRNFARWDPGVRNVTQTIGNGGIVEYDAQLRFNGVLGVADRALRPFFNRIADRAADGLCIALQGTKV